MGGHRSIRRITANKSARDIGDCDRWSHWEKGTRRDRHLRDICIRHGFCVPGVMGGVVCSGIKERLERNEWVSRPRGASLERGRGSRKSEDERSYSLIDLFSKSVDSSSGFSFSIVVDISSTEIEDFPLPTVYPWWTRSESCGSRVRVKCTCNGLFVWRSARENLFALAGIVSRSVVW